MSEKEKTTERYICEDAGKALEELESKLKEDRRQMKTSRKGSYDDGVVHGISLSLKRLEEVKENWKANWPD